jgi:hypothetical protein
LKSLLIFEVAMNTKPFASLFVATALLVVPAAFAQDDDSLIDDSDLLLLEDELADAELMAETDDVTAAAPRALPPGVYRVRSMDGEFLPPFELQQACSAGWCGDVVVNTVTGRVLYSHEAWQPGTMETGYGQEVIVVGND